MVLFANFLRRTWSVICAIDISQSVTYLYSVSGQKSNLR